MSTNWGQISYGFGSIVRFVLLIPFLLAICVGGILALWQHSFNPLLLLLLVAIVIETVFFLIPPVLGFVIFCTIKVIEKIRL